MGMRKDWQTAKSNSELAFKEGSKGANREKIKSGDVLTSGFEPYPIKFSKNLGPALDDWEAAEKKKDATKKAAAVKKAQPAIQHYEEEAKKLKGHAQTFLTTELTNIKKTLGIK
jgi:hypothetical protein